MNAPRLTSSCHDSIDVFAYLLAKHRDVRSFCLFEAPLTPPLQERYPLARHDWEPVEHGLRLREATHMPFWDAVMLSCFDASETPANLLQAALYHQRSALKTWRMGDNGICESCLRDSARNVAAGHIVALCSALAMNDGSIKHIPMLDFHCPNNPENLALVMSVVHKLDIPGHILCSGKSYHFYGDDLLLQNELTVFLGRALLFSPIVDRAWIAHQMIENACALRVSPRPEYGGTPYIVAYVPEKQCDHRKNPARTPESSVQKHSGTDSCIAPVYH